jgi:hypothetical protein
MISALFIMQTPPPIMYVQVFGEGAVTDSAGDIYCMDSGGSCDIGYNVVNLVSLTATPAAGCHFVGWSDSDCGASVNCELNVDLSRPVLPVIAEFEAYAAPPARVMSEITTGRWLPHHKVLDMIPNIVNTKEPLTKSVSNVWWGEKLRIKAYPRADSSGEKRR